MKEVCRFVDGGDFLRHPINGMSALFADRGGRSFGSFHSLRTTKEKRGSAILV